MRPLPSHEAEPGRAEPEPEPRRAEPSRAEPSQAEPGRGAGPSPGTPCHVKWASRLREVSIFNTKSAQMFRKITISQIRARAQINQPPQKLRLVYAKRYSFSGDWNLERRCFGGDVVLSTRNDTFS